MVRDKFYFGDEEDEPTDLGDDEVEDVGMEDEESEEEEEDLGIEGEEEKEEI